MLYFCFVTVGVFAALNVFGMLLMAVKRPSLGTFCLPAAYIAIAAVHKAEEKFAPAGKNEKLRYYDEVYVGENPEKMRLITEIKLAGVLMLIIFGSAAFYLAANFSGLFKSEFIDSLLRPKEGTKDYRLSAWYENEKYDFTFSLDESYPTASEMEDVMEKIKEVLPGHVLADNDSAEHVTKKLDFSDDAFGPNVSISWLSSDTDTVAGDGRVASDRLKSEKTVELTAAIKYYELEDSLTLTVTVCPTDDRSRNKVLIDEKLTGLAEKGRYEESLELPDEIEGEEIKFSIYKEDNSLALLLLGFLAAFLVLPYGMQLKRRKREERNTQLILDYPDVTAKLALLLSSGLNVRASFERIATNYEKRKKKGSRRRRTERRYAYEEMIRTRNEIALGISEAEAYERFGRRCGNMYYIRLASLLNQNLKKGNESLIESLRLEISEASKEKQAEIRKRGEQVGIKLLLPMAGMFVLVLAVILVPAFLSM